MIRVFRLLSRCWEDITSSHLFAHKLKRMIQHCNEFSLFSFQALLPIIQSPGHLDWVFAATGSLGSIFFFLFQWWARDNLRTAFKLAQLEIRGLSDHCCALQSRDFTFEINVILLKPSKNTNTADFINSSVSNAPLGRRE